MTKKEIAKMLNEALELEHAAHVQYLSHAETICGVESEGVVARLKEIASDEAEHAAKFRNLIGAYLEEVPSMGIARTRKAKSLKDILKINLEDELEAVRIYTRIMDKIAKERKDLPYCFLRLEHDLRHVIMEEQEHAVELKALMGKLK
ncbi:MAG: ferritin-like domain-containing protein [Candidatus Micrarchaeota archaeon]